MLNARWSGNFQLSENFNTFNNFIMLWVQGGVTCHDSEWWISVSGEFCGEFGSVVNFGSWWVLWWILNSALKDEFNDIQYLVSTTITQGYPALLVWNFRRLLLPDVAKQKCAMITAFNPEVFGIVRSGLACRWTEIGALDSSTHLDGPRGSNIHFYGTFLE